MADLLADPRVYDQLDLYLADKNNVDEVMAQIPTLFGISVKASFLGFRALGLTAKQALEVLELDEEYLDYWRESEPYFLEFEATHLHRIQRECSAEIIRMGFLRNMALLVAKDAQIIRTGMVNLDYLSKREFDYFTKVRNHYTPGDLYNLEKALSPEKHQQNMTINLTWGNTISQTIEEGNVGGLSYEDRISLHDSKEGRAMLSLPEANQVCLSDES